ncbi:type VII secretion-associated serine protease mycosin [Streptomyces sp. NPDC000594]|uniref:type VII secretion-associated serine protease mycosin n=1 Tax=Streptomyces sp. NPDC000594 TaxID=3154261 RepID=UPI00331CE92F
MPAPGDGVPSPGADRPGTVSPLGPGGPGELPGSGPGGPGETPGLGSARGEPGRGGPEGHAASRVDGAARSRGGSAGGRGAAVAGLALALLAVASGGPVGAVPPVRCAAPAVRTSAELPWSQARLEPQRVWDITRGAGQTVAVVDSGVDGGVPQLAGRVLRGLDVVVGGGRGDTDCVGHGTFVAGLIAARPVRGLRFAGVAPDARILPVRQTTDGEDGTANGMARAIRAAVDAGAGVVNVSVNSPSRSRLLDDAVRYAFRKDVVIVASAGNQSTGPGAVADPVSFPAAYPGVLAVAAVDRDDRPAPFSRRGDFVGIAAPGVDILSLGTGGPGHRVDQGTSFATPYVAGTAALVRARHPELTAAQVVHRLQTTADHPPTRLPEPGVGWGVVNPFEAVTAVVPGENGGTTGPGTPEAADLGGAAAGGAPPEAAAPVAGEPDPARGALPLLLGLAALVVLGGLGVLLARLAHRLR